MTSGFRGAFETGQTTGAVADARGLTRPSRGGCGPLQGSQGGVKELALWRHEALTYARTREERADCQRLLSVRYARAFTWRARAADASPPVRGKPSPAARTRKNLGPLSQTAAGLGNGRGGDRGPGCVPSGMLCARLLVACGDPCGKTGRYLGLCENFRGVRSRPGFSRYRHAGARALLAEAAFELLGCDCWPGLFPTSARRRRPPPLKVSNRCHVARN